MFLLKSASNSSFAKSAVESTSIYIKTFQILSSTMLLTQMPLSFLIENMNCSFN